MYSRIYLSLFLSIAILKWAHAQQLQFSGYLGGSNFEHIRDITTDADGNIYVTGGTDSPDFPVTQGAFQQEHKQTYNSPVYMTFSKQ